jgi:hypothetical protein
MKPSKIPPLTVDSFADDALNLQPYAKRLEDFLLVERTFVEGALVVSLGAPFGSGKTTFLRMWKRDLESRRKENKELPYPLILNAWESDFCGDPFLAVISELVKVVDAIEGKQTAASKTFREAAKEAAWFGVGLANSFVSNWSGVDPLAAGEIAIEKTETKPDILASYRERLESLEHIRAELSRHFGEGTPGAVLLIDELDRCRPEYAIGYLETIKHVFGVRGLMFVLAVDSDRLAASAETVFGRLNFDEFYRKFVHRSISLPSPDENQSAQLIARYVERFLEHEGLRLSFAKIEHHHIEDAVRFMRALKMTPRQAQEVFRIAGHIFATSDKDMRGRLLWALTSGTILLAIIRVGDSRMFTSLKNKTTTLEQFGAYLIKLLGAKRAHWWFSLYITGSDKIPPNEELDALYLKVGLLEGPHMNGFNQFHFGWGHRDDRIHEIITKIEELQSFK